MIVCGEVTLAHRSVDSSGKRVREVLPGKCRVNAFGYMTRGTRCVINFPSRAHFESISPKMCTDVCEVIYMDFDDSPEWGEEPEA